MSTQHSAGPWRAFGFSVVDQEYRLIANCLTAEPRTDQWNSEEAIKVDQANAQLIAACPTMLALLRRTLDVWDARVAEQFPEECGIEPPLWRDVRALIAQASIEKET